MQSDAEKLKGDVHIPTKDMFSRIYRYLKPEMARFVGDLTDEKRQDYIQNDV